MTGDSVSPEELVVSSDGRMQTKRVALEVGAVCSKLLLRTVAVPMLAAAMVGCHFAGPVSVKTGRAHYNTAIQQTNSQQLLLNIVRLKYRDVPFFLEVASVSTSFDVGATAGGRATLPEAARKTYGLDAGVSFHEKPTVTYTPLQGEQFVSQLMSPIDLNTILLLYHSGWSVERVFRVCLASVNGVKNAPSASGPTPTRVPTYEEFRKLTKLLRVLQVRGVLEMGHGTSEGNDEPLVVIRIAEEALECDEVKELCDLLALERGRGSFPLTTEIGVRPRDRLAVVPRSLISSFFFVSQSVEVPSTDERAGRVTVTRDEDGNRFDWTEVTGGLMRIRSAGLPPVNAYSVVYYRGSWFYIDDSDLTSKSTFSLLMQLFALQAGDIRATGPVLTLPVSR